MALPVLVMLPKPAVPKFAFGVAKLGRLVMLNTSARSCSRVALWIAMFLKNDMSMRRCGGPCRVFRPVLPAVLIGWAAYAATLNHCSTVGLLSAGSPTVFGRSVPPVLLRAVPWAIVNAVPVCQ